ncbi:MAG: hypothetical protein R6V85_13085 [Polyangia bacterium]
MNEGKIFLARYPDGSEKVLGDPDAMRDERFVEGRWVDFGDPAVRNADWSACQAVEIAD